MRFFLFDERNVEAFLISTFFTHVEFLIDLFVYQTHSATSIVDSVCVWLVNLDMYGSRRLRWIPRLASRRNPIHIHIRKV